MPAFFKAKTYKMKKKDFQSFPLQVANLLMTPVTEPC